MNINEMTTTEIIDYLRLERDYLVIYNGNKKYYEDTFECEFEDENHDWGLFVEMNDTWNENMVEERMEIFAETWNNFCLNN